MAQSKKHASTSDQRVVRKTGSSARRSSDLSVTRRSFLKKAGIAGAGATAAYIAPQFTTVWAKRAYAAISGATVDELPGPTPWNVAAGVTAITASSPIYGRPASALTDGDKLSSNYLELQDTYLQWVEIDLGTGFDVSRIKLWHYYDDGRSYKDVIVELSVDRVGWVQVFNNDANNSAARGVGLDAEYVETASGKEILVASPVTARYLRLWSNGSSSNAENHYVELEVYGVPA